MPDLYERACAALLRLRSIFPDIRVEVRDGLTDWQKGIGGLTIHAANKSSVRVIHSIDVDTPCGKLVYFDGVWPLIEPDEHSCGDSGKALEHLLGRIDLSRCLRYDGNSEENVENATDTKNDAVESKSDSGMRMEPESCYITEAAITAIIEEATRSYGPDRACLAVGEDGQRMLLLSSGRPVRELAPLSADGEDTLKLQSRSVLRGMSGLTVIPLMSLPLLVLIADIDGEPVRNGNPDINEMEIIRKCFGDTGLEAEAVHALKTDPATFLCGAFNSAPSDMYGCLAEKSAEMGVSLLLPDVNLAEYEFCIVKSSPEPTIRYVINDTSGNDGVFWESVA